ncbi:MAG: putative lipoprotein [Micavibrio sp.]|nr:putative lipoprotein [Micavibrio sp.]
MKFRILLAGSALVSVLALGACDAIIYGGPSNLSQSHAGLYNDRYQTEIETGTLNEGQINALARGYWSNGNGPMTVNVTFDPKSKTNTAKKAASEAIRLATVLKRQGVGNIQHGTTALEQSGTLSRTMISYDSVKAKAPDDCPETLGMEFAERDHGEDYKMGCSIETFTARQIARPADLAGNRVMDSNNGRRNANMLELYQMGQPNPDLKGVNASEGSK